jgi:hypothetical protein
LGFDPNTLFLNAGLNGETNGLFAAIETVPSQEPSYCSRWPRFLWRGRKPAREALVGQGSEPVAAA